MCPSKRRPFPQKIWVVATTSEDVTAPGLSLVATDVATIKYIYEKVLSGDDDIVKTQL
jgi:hypothetical protein